MLLTVGGAVGRSKEVVKLAFFGGELADVGGSEN